MTKSNRKVKGTVAFDFDGVMHSDPHYRWPLAETDFSLINKVQARGYAAAVMTCNDVSRVAATLRNHGFRAVADVRMSRMYWHDPEAILVTGRKICADFYVDDKAVRYQFGQSHEIVTDLLDEREGYRGCPQGRHWGPHGAAGVLPFTVFRGRLYVLLGLRSRKVNYGGTWACFGGALNFRHEDTWVAATRELHEETSGLEGHVSDWADYYRHDCECGWFYVTFLAEVPCTEPEDNDGPAWLPEVRVSTGHSSWETDSVR
jgi:ADP-ribose pyrophosphatase YjhB (NUDIX family)